MARSRGGIGNNAGSRSVSAGPGMNRGGIAKGRGPVRGPRPMDYSDRGYARKGPGGLMKGSAGGGRGAGIQERQTRNIHGGRDSLQGVPDMTQFMSKRMQNAPSRASMKQAQKAPKGTYSKPVVKGKREQRYKGSDNQARARALRKGRSTAGGRRPPAAWTPAPGPSVAEQAATAAEIEQTRQDDARAWNSRYQDQRGR